MQLPRARMRAIDVGSLYHAFATILQNQRKNDETSENVPQCWCTVTSWNWGWGGGGGGGDKGQQVIIHGQNIVLGKKKICHFGSFGFAPCLWTWLLYYISLCAQKKDIRQIKLSVRLRPFTGHATIYMCMSYHTIKWTIKPVLLWPPGYIGHLAIKTTWLYTCRPPKRLPR